jgi:hypothetical protein
MWILDCYFCAWPFLCDVLSPINEARTFLFLIKRFGVVTEMANKGGYVPPQYVPLYGLDTEEDRVPPVEENHATRHKLSWDPSQWSSGICACFDDPQSCMLLSDL